ncbi:MAG: thiol peroxidase [Bacteroidota bacterium]
MANITLGGNPVQTSGELPSVGTEISSFRLTKMDLSQLNSEDLRGKKILYNIFPSINTGVCSKSAKEFNTSAASLEDASVLCVARDLPFAFKNFCDAEGIENVICASSYKDDSFEKAFNVSMVDGLFESLFSRAVVVADAEGKVIYTEQVSEIGEEPNYEAALAALNGA